MTEDKERGLERRLEAVERAVAEIQRRLAHAPDTDNWLERVIGSISDVEAFEEALRHGRAYRDSDRPVDEGDDEP
jgi:hypothetical protein